MPKRPKVNFKPEAWVKLTELKEHPKNPRVDLSENLERFEQLKNSIVEGVFEPVKISKLSGFCIAGNQRLKAFEELGFEEVPVMYNEYKTEKEEFRDMIKDNNEWGEYDYLSLHELIDDDDDLENLGFTDDEIDKLASIDDKEDTAIDDGIEPTSEDPDLLRFIIGDTIGKVYRRDAKRFNDLLREAEESGIELLADKFSYILNKLNGKD